MNLFSHTRMFWSLLFSACVFGDIIREDNFFKGEFSNNHKGRMLRVLMVFNNLPLDKCAVKCIQHITCKTVNYNLKKQKCELTDVDFNDDEADKLSYGWYNYGTQPKVNGEWGPWRNVTRCTETCNGGTMNQARDCDSPAPNHGGDFCSGNGERTIDCNTHPCPVNGNWGAWKNVTTCSAPCVGGQLNQTRSCDSPHPQHGGKDCIGEREKTINCNNHSCPVHKKWGAWQNTTACSAKCDGGTLTQTRVCDSPGQQQGSNSHLGYGCPGNNSRTVSCNTHACPVVNVALNKRAIQSGYNHLAKDGVDGNLGTYAFTAFKSNPWWQVDIGDDMKINHIEFHTFPMSNNVRVDGKTAHGPRYSLCITDLKIDKEVVKFFCDSIQTFRYIRLTLQGQGQLYVTELEVYVKLS